jgi:nucleoside-diphosphate-sugar epimerase
MRILITGGAGFIGSHLAERCLDAGWKVSVLDDLSTGSFENIAPLKCSPRFSYTIDTVFNVPVVGELVDSADVVIHLAAAVGVRLIVDSPVRTIETNVHGTEVVLRAAAKKRKRVLLASTSEVYGKSTEVPFRESASLVLGATTRSRWSYACSKALDEFLALAYWNEKRVPVTIVRLFNTVGPRQTDLYGMVLPTLVKQALLGEPLTVYGSGDQRRCFAYVGDVVEALMRIIRAPRLAGEVINIGNDTEISISALAHLVCRLTGSHSEIRQVPYEVAYGPGFEDMPRRVPSVDKLQRLVGYRPVTPVETIIELVAEDIRTRIAESSPAESASGVWAAGD